MSLVCPFARLSVSEKSERPADKSEGNVNKEQDAPEVIREQENGEESSLECPVADNVKTGDLYLGPKCPLGYDSGSFKIGPLSCVICRALLYDSCRCVPCTHVFCRGCILRFQDCVVCGADIERLDPDPQLQGLVERFIEGHGRIKRQAFQADGESSPAESRPSNIVSYEDVSLVRGSFLIQHAMRAFQGQNFESAKSRLQLCVEDTKDELSRNGDTTGTSSQLGAVLGMLGDCCRAMGDAQSSIMHYQESIRLLLALPGQDNEVVHALSVSLNKLGDLKYYADDLTAARAFYSQALDMRKKSTDFSKLSSQVLDVAVSLAKVGDVNRALGNEGEACRGFEEAVQLLETLSSPDAKHASPLEIRRVSVLEFVRRQLEGEKV